jgi:hypothetical protein
MPAIARSPVSPPMERASLGYETMTKSSAGIPQTAPAINRIVQSFKGVNNNHIIDVIDKSGDSTQYYKYLDHCQTCAWEGRYHVLPEAVAYAKMHVGQ